MVILYKLTSRSRPAKMYKAFKSVVDNAELNWIMVLPIDLDDSITLNSDELEQIKSDDRVSIHIGTSKNKIDFSAISSHVSLHSKKFSLIYMQFELNLLQNFFNCKEIPSANSKSKLDHLSLKPAI